MPKKTKKEKLLAAYRKQLKILQSQTLEHQSHPAPSSPKKEQLMSPPIKVKELSVNISEEDLATRRFFFQDFQKSLILIGMIIALEIALYFVRIIK